MNGSGDSAAGSWLFRLLLLAYPRSFRRRYREALIDAYRREREASETLARSRVVFWTWVAADTALGGLLERLDGWRRPQRAPRDRLPDAPRHRRLSMISDVLRDVRLGYRSLRRSPGYTLTALLILSIGIGSSAIVFTVANSVLFGTPPHVRDSGRLVRLTRSSERSLSHGFGYPDYMVFAERADSFAGLAAYDSGGMAVTVERGADYVTARAWVTSANYFDVLGVPMAAGRGFADKDDDILRDGAVAVVSESFWRTALGEEPQIVGSTLMINETPLVVIGVAPGEFRGVSPMDQPPDLWVPLTMQPVLAGRKDNGALVRTRGRRIAWLDVVGRLADGTTVEQADAEVQAVNDYLRREFGEWNEGRGTYLSSDPALWPNQRAEVLRLTRLMGLVVATVLLVVCANVAILQLARSCRRRSEFGLRAALGAGRIRLMRELLIEAVLLSAGGVAGGYLIARLGGGTVAGSIPLDLAVELVPDASVLAFASALGVVTALLFGLAPALSLSRGNLAESFGGVAAASGRSVPSAGLVVVQVAASVVLVTGASLFVRSLLTADAVDPGFARRGRVFVSAALGDRDQSAEATLDTLDQTLTRIRALPDVEAASAAVLRPFRGSWATDVAVGAERGPDAETVEVFMNVVDDGYFRAMEIDLLEGRVFERGDMRGSDSVLVANRAAAELLWPGQDPIGKTIESMAQGVEDRVVGVVENSDYNTLGEGEAPILYASLHQYPETGVVYVVATADDSAAITQLVREAVLAAEPRVRLSGAITIEEVIDEQLGTYRLGARTISLFGALGVLLAAIGIYGVLSYWVGSQRREIGIRLALGDTWQGAVRRVVWRGVRVAGIGVALGLLVAPVAVRLIAGMLFGVDPHDTMSFVIVPVAILMIAALASGLAARRAAAVQPADAFRSH